MTALSTSPAPSRVDVLEDVLVEALDGDHRLGTGTGLLLVGVDGCRRAAPEAPPQDTAPAGALHTVVRRVRSAVRSSDAWVPLTDDLHAVVLTGLPRTGAEAVVDRVSDTLLHALEASPLTGPETGARVSIGASLAPGRAATAGEAVAQARTALAAARAAGGHCARIHPV